MQDTLLIELLTEELPPKSLSTLGRTFAAAVVAEIMERQLASTDTPYDWYATPRRLGVRIRSVLAQAPNVPISEKIMPVKVALDVEGNPSLVLLKKLKDKGIPVSEVMKFERRLDGRTETFFYNNVAMGAILDNCLDLIVADALRKLPIPKVMRWSDKEVEFVRPAHGLVMMHGTRVVPGTVLGLESSNVTLGHRFLSNGQITIGNAADYTRILTEQGRVIADFTERKRVITSQLHALAGELGASLAEHEDLLDEVTALVEYPVAYSGEFSPEFLDVPQECLILSMKQHQKYFPLLDKTTGKLLPRFLVVSNLKTDNPGNIIHGNERVLRARLADAKFFFDHDRKTRLEERVPKLAQVVYHNKLGSQLERVHRIQKLAGTIAQKLGAHAALAERAGFLSKADLLTDMVGEFPELQGIMGQYYALHDSEPEAVARAVEAHYHPRFAGDALPEDNVGASVALADKLDALVGIYGIGLVPTGERDPFGLRRHALGVLRILLEKSLPLDLMLLLQLAKSQFPAEMLADSVTVDLHQFMLERLKNYLRDQEFLPDEIDAVVSQNPTRIDLVLPRLMAVREFKKLPEAESLATANKRIQNILKKTTVPDGAPDVSLMQEDAERALFKVTTHLSPAVSSLLHNGDYTDALCALAQARKEVDRFFDEVMVMTDEPLLRNNRLALLKQLAGLMNQVADISKLAA